MAWTQTDLDNLDSAIKRGVRSVTNPDGTQVTFGSLDEMLRLRSVMQAEVGGSTRTPSATSVARISKVR